MGRDKETNFIIKAKFKNTLTEASFNLRGLASGGSCRYILTANAWVSPNLDDFFPLNCQVPVKLQQ